MTPESIEFLKKAHKLLAQAETMLTVGLADAAGRTAYLAAFHAAQAFLFGRLGKLFKSHRGVHSEFARLARDDARIDPLMRVFLSEAYNLKAIADYETGPGSDVSPERAKGAVEQGKRFVALIGELTSASDADSNGSLEEES